MIFLFTDFTYHGPYVGEMKAVLARTGYGIKVIDLMHDAPRFNPMASAILLKALSLRFVAGDICMAIVDPAVGSEQQASIIVEADGVYYVGPDNGVFDVIMSHSNKVTISDIVWHGDTPSNSFHGRDLYAPVASSLAKLDKNHTTDKQADAQFTQKIRPEQSCYRCIGEIHKIIYIDGYGNLISGMNEKSINKQARLSVNGIRVEYARTFSATEKGDLFWYINSMGLVEIAANQASAKKILNAAIDNDIEFIN